MGCSASKNKAAKGGHEPRPTAKATSNGFGTIANGTRSDNATATASRTNGVPTADTAQKRAGATSSIPVKEAAVGAANQGAVMPRDKETPSSAAPGKEAHQTNSDAKGAHSRDQDTDVVLPAGNWVKTEGTPYYYCAKENLYYHPPSCQFYDPTNSMWYDPEKSEWYCDDASDDQAA